MTGIVGAESFAFREGELLETAGIVERDVKVFRVGTFTDMLGRESTWTHDDLDRAVENFHILRDQNILPNVPVRQDHTASVRDVVGYFTGLRREGDFLLADFEWADDEAKNRWDRKQLRNRSLEIGQYVTNDGSKYNPVVLGLAFVDLPAVEGLYRIADHGESMNHEAEPTPTPEAVEEVEETPEAAAEETEIETSVEPTETQTPPAPEVPQPEPVGAHRQPTQTYAFRVEGQEVSDFARVQAHIEELETFRTETIQGSRLAFVDGLVERKVILPPQADQFRTLVTTMTGDQFDQFKAGFDGVGTSDLFARHDLGDTGGSHEVADATQDRITVLEGIIRNHRLRGASDDEIQALRSYQELQTIKSATA